MRGADADPPRLETTGSEALRALVRSRQARPSEAALERISKRLASAAVANPAARQPHASPTGWAMRRWKLGALGVAVTAGLLFSLRESRPLAPSRPVEPAGAPSVPPSPRPVADAPRFQEGSDPAAISVDKLPPAPPAAAPSTSPSGRDDRPRTSATELELVQRMKAALPVDPARALSLTNEHARQYPSGEFVQEREVIAVEALVELGKRDEASRRANAFVGRFPNTPYTARLEKAIGHPLLQRHVPVAEPGAPLR